MIWLNFNNQAILCFVTKFLNDGLDEFSRQSDRINKKNTCKGSESGENLLWWAAIVQGKSSRNKTSFFSFSKLIAGYGSGSKWNIAVNPQSV